MKANTKFFGEVDIADDKVLEFPNGIIGFENLRKFAIIYDIDKGPEVNLSYLQSLEEPLLAIPAVNPLVVLDNYNPMIEDSFLEPLDNPGEEDLMVLLAMTVPPDLTKMTVNMKAPFIINTRTRKGGQIIVENSDYKVRFPVYDILQANKERAEAEKKAGE